MYYLYIWSEHNLKVITKDWNCFVTTVFSGGEGVRGTGISFLLEVILFGYFVPARSFCC